MKEMKKHTSFVKFFYINWVIYKNKSLIKIINQRRTFPKIVIRQLTGKVVR